MNFRTRLREMVDDLVGHDLAGRHVVAVAETAGEDQDVILIEELLVFDHPVDVDAVRLGPGQLQCVLRFQIGVDSRRPQNDCSNLFHL